IGGRGRREAAPGQDADRPGSDAEHLRLKAREARAAATAAAEAAKRAADDELNSAGSEQVNSDHDEDGPAEAPSSEPESRPWAYRVTVSLLLLFCVMGAASGIWLSLQHREVSDSIAREEQVLDFARGAVEQLISTDRADAQGYVDRIVADSTGQWYDDFQMRKKAVHDTIAASAGVVTGHVDEAGIETRNDDGSTTVLLAASSETTVESPSPSPEPVQPDPQSPTVQTGEAGGSGAPQSKQYQIRVDVATVDGQLKLAKVGFVQ
ncbi:MAG: hypothetical protein WAW17_30175, partial [Rhodococcus sp. (in: high G+C Gram-positive bacteria)]|uniref:hypothetical protein n=1 Tax=Rhodococcus sp. TaxID=1831 RepID=UPI003BB05D4C